MKYQNPSTCKDTNWLKFSFQNQSAKTQMLGIILNFDFLKGLVFKNVASACPTQTGIQTTPGFMT